MLTRRPVRTLILAMFVIAALAWLRNYSESSAPAAFTEDEAGPPSARIARETTPTIVEPNENWLHEDPSESPATEAVLPEQDSAAFDAPNRFDASPLR